MSLLFRMVLIFVSLLTTYYMLKKIRQSKVQIEDSIFWIVFSSLLLIFSVFPSLADYCTQLLGIYSTVNFIFLFVIFVLIIKLFLMTVRVSQMDNKMRELTQKIAIDKLLDEQKQKKDN